MPRLHDLRRKLLIFVQACHYTKGIVDAGLACDTDMFYSGVIERGSGTLQSSPVVFTMYGLCQCDQKKQTYVDLTFGLSEIDIDGSDLCISAKMYFAVVIQPDYPNSVPVFALCIQWINERTGLTDEHVRVR